MNIYVVRLRTINLRPSLFISEWENVSIAFRCKCSDLKKKKFLGPRWNGRRISAIAGYAHRRRGLRNECVTIFHSETQRVVAAVAKTSVFRTACSKKKWTKPLCNQSNSRFAWFQNKFTRFYAKKEKLKEDKYRWTINFRPKNSVV